MQVDGKVVFFEYIRMPDGSPGPAETKQLVRNCGDIITAVNGVSVVNKSFDEVLSIVRDAVRHSDKVNFLFQAAK